MSDSGVPCPGADKDHPHNLIIKSPETGNLICAYEVTTEWMCPFNYRDEHKVDWWRHGFGPLGKIGNES